MKMKLILTIMYMVVALFAAHLWAADAPVKKGKARGSSLSKIDKSTKLAYEGGTLPLTTTPVVGTPTRKYNTTFKPGAENLGPDEIRVTILGSGDPFVKRSQSSASVLIEVGNEQHDFFFFDLGSGALANFDGLKLPVTSTTKVFLTHLHSDHMGDLPTLLGSPSPRAGDGTL